MLDFISQEKVQSIDQKALFQNDFKELNTINLELQKLSFDENLKSRLQKLWKNFKI